jgi:hypothetical protein
VRVLRKLSLQRKLQSVGDYGFEVFTAIARGVKKE